jgi:hypothetical protein
VRKLSIEEVQILRQNSKGVLFTVDELKVLAEGTASFKVFNKAEEILDKFRKHMQMPPGRQEIAQNFIHYSKFQEFITKEFAPRVNRQIDIMNILIKKGIITIAEINAMSHETTAIQWKHLCPECKWEGGGSCSGFILAGDVFKNLPLDLARKVIECPDFEGKGIPQNINGGKHDAI